MEKAFLTPQQAAEFLGIKMKTFYSLAGRGLIPAVRFGRQIRISIKSLEDYRDNPKLHYCPRPKKRIRKPVVRSTTSESSNYWRMKKYGLTQQQFAAILEKQGGRCAICRTDEWLPHVDHDHVTGQIRGLLCVNCNTLLGRAKDSVLALRQAIRYLGKANTFWEKDMPPKLREMSERQAERDAIAREMRPN